MMYNLRYYPGILPGGDEETRENFMIAGLPTEI
jgi:hypothetical protein